jgi:hypothetical protein
MSGGGKRGRRGTGRGAGIPAEARALRSIEPLPAGSHLGDLSPDVEEIDLTFGWYGETIRVNPTMSELEFIDFTERAMKIAADTPEAVTVMKDQFRGFIHPDDFDAFWDLSRRHRVGIDRLGQVMRTVVEATAGRPTGLPSDSSAGQHSTAASSRADSSLRVINRLDDDGRPDLAMAVVMRREAQVAG